MKVDPSQKSTDGDKQILWDVTHKAWEINQHVNIVTGLLQTRLYDRRKPNIIPATELADP